MRNRKYLKVAALACVLLVGCEEVTRMPQGSLSGESESKAALGMADSPPAASASADMVMNEPTAKPAQTLDVAAQEHADRLVIYDANISLVVPDIAQTLTTIRSTATQMGGYLQEIDGGTISVRVPAARFQDALSAMEKLGEVTQRHIKAEDITEQMHDLKIRLDNAEQIRKELLDLIQKSQKMEDTLKIEQELMRVTEQVELLKGKIQYLSSQAAFSTISVTVNSPLPQQQMVSQIPFAWVRQLGDGLVAGVAEPNPDTSSWHARNVRFDLPKNYIRYYEREHVTEAMSSEGMLIKLQRQDNYDGGDIAFWSTLARRAMVENRAITVQSESDITLDSKAAAHLIVGVKDIAGKPHGYLVALIATKHYVYTFEAWGPKEQFNQDLKALEQAVTTLDIKQ